MKQQNTRSKGSYGEGIAVEYLRNHGYRIIEKNYRNRFGEVDIIAKEGSTIVFIEVKTRNTLFYGSPAAAVDLWKQKRIGRVAAGYVTERRLAGPPCRFDVISICNGEIEVIKDAFDLQGDLW